ncbi:hypothetical protein QO034_23235 [Sedimentitalea sp. JM2-8]|uniref:Uncharacterized protein n=1 Tax=Sedimentitalea xiamensis TaxID=3050037 RepID=A0ABT7FLC6_9RHOB|nr:hypothetical protein [Sedimentitalea xiamensis]MDK3075962.1 hypothetical protein [Sedimentitalea xiamensis]
MKFTLKTDLTEGEVEGQCLFVAFSEPDAHEDLAKAAEIFSAYTRQQLEELSFHKARLDSEGVADKEVAASLLALYENAETARRASEVVDAFVSALTPFGPFYKGRLQ